MWIINDYNFGHPKNFFDNYFKVLKETEWCYKEGQQDYSYYEFYLFDPHKIHVFNSLRRERIVRYYFICG